LKVGGRVFATLLVRDRTSMARTMQVGDVSGMLAWALGDFQKNPQIPRIISDASWAVVGAPDLSIMYDFLGRSMSFVAEESQLRELLLGAARTASRGSFLSPSSLVSLAQNAARMTAGMDNLPAYLLLTLSKKNQDALARSAWVRSYTSAYGQSLGQYYHPGTSSGGGGGSVSVSGIAFQSIPSGDLVMGPDTDAASLGKSFGRDLLHPVHVQSFYLGTTEVTNAFFLRFLAENADWSPANTSSLIAKGLVTDGYLAGWSNGRPPIGNEDLPVTGVSWYAAKAFCDWLTRRAAAALPGYVARLPLESEWEWAARGGLRGMPYPLGTKIGKAVFAAKGITGPSPVGASEPNGYGLRDTIGNVWEWCGDPFNRTSFLLSSFDPTTNAAFERALPSGPDRSVRGGGWGNQAGAEKVSTRGSQPADWCTPYLGFRVALARQ
jgi:formylglycine-generating enzyme required for sulfatase activity